MSLTITSKQSDARKQYYLFPSYGIERWRVIRKVSMAEGVAHENRGAWKRVYDPNSGALTGFRLVSPEEKRVDLDVASIHSSSAISGPNPQTKNPGEMELNVERSRTAGLAEERRLERAAQNRLPEDRVERVQAKVRVYVQLGPAKGDILRVWPRIA